MGTIDTWGARTARAAAGYAPAAGANKMVAIEVDPATLPAGKPWVRVQVTESVDSPVDAGMIVILSHGRHKRDIPLTAIS